MQQDISSEDLSEEYVLQNCLFGNIIAFKFVSNHHDPKKNVTQKKYSGDFVSIPNVLKEDKYVEALASWYTCRSDGVLRPVDDKNHFFVDIKNYIATINNFKINSEQLSISSENLTDVLEMLVKYFNN